jgi:hypothetical protein
MTAAFADEAMPTELKALIADYMMTEWWPESATGAPLSMEEWEALHDKIFDHTKEQFFESLEQFLYLNWPVPRLVKWVLAYHELTLDQEMIDAVQEIEAEDAEDEDEEDGQPQLRNITPALIKAQEEYAAGTLSPEREAAILTIFGNDFFEAVVQPARRPQ